MRLSPIRGDFREERPYIGVQYEIHLLAADSSALRGPRPGRSPYESLRMSSLISLSTAATGFWMISFERSDRERALRAVFFRNITSAGRLRPICSCWDPCVQVLDTLIQALLKGLPRHAVDARCRVTLPRIRRRSQCLMVTMVQERSELLLLSSPCGEPYAFQRL
jgi:hypothetical protein